MSILYLSYIYIVRYYTPQCTEIYDMRTEFPHSVTVQLYLVILGILHRMDRKKSLHSKISQCI